MPLPKALLSLLIALSSLLLSACGPFAGAPNVLDSVHDGPAYRSVMKAVPDSARIWIANPLNEHWTRWKITEVTGGEGQHLVACLKKATYCRNGGSVYLLDLNFQDAKSDGIGVMILEYPGNQFVGFEAHAARETHNALRIVTITRFVPDKNKLTMIDDWDRQGGFDGVLLDCEITPIFVKLQPGMQEEAPKN